MDEIRKLALWATGIIAALIIIGSIVLAFTLISIEVPTTPVLIISNSITEQEAKGKEITNYKELVSSLQDQRTNIFDFMVLKTLLPLFNYLIASVLTYIFTNTALQAFRTYVTQKYKDK